jgi:UDP-GlcNAc:undecaprenyl-phosphate/decaprenyl-phosphate GlcNAc-1-phosphate transferase
VRALPLLLALAIAILLAPITLRALAEGGHTRPNYRARTLPFPFGVLNVASALLALIPLLLLQRLADTSVLYPETETIALYALGIAALGLIDDTLDRATPDRLPPDRPTPDRPTPDRPTPDRPGPGGSDPDRSAPRGWRGHGRALLRGRPSTGALKAAGSLGLALLALDRAGLSVGRWLLAAGVLVLTTHLFNLLDLRPGRSTKAFVLLGAALAIGSADPRPLWALGLFAGPALIAGVYDLRERALLGDTGASVLGALAGLWLVLTLSSIGQAIALALLALIAVYGELRSLSDLIERAPGLRRLDSWGRPS